MAEDLTCTALPPLVRDDGSGNRRGTYPVALFDTHRWPHWPEVVRDGDTRELVHWRESRLGWNDPRRRRNAQIANEVTEAGVIVRLQETIYAAAGAAQLRISEILGPRRFAQMHSSLELLTEQLEGSPAIC